MKDTVIKFIHDAPSDAHEIMLGLAVMVFLVGLGFLCYRMIEKA